MSNQVNGQRAALPLAVALVGVFVGRAESDAIEGPRNLEVLLQPVALGPVQVQPGAGPGVAAGPATPAECAAGGVVQPSSNVEATALAIAYDAVRGGEAKVTPEAVGKFAAEMINAFSAARK